MNTFLVNMAIQFHQNSPVGNELMIKSSAQFFKNHLHNYNYVTKVKIGLNLFEKI